jgi:hypothetical protein
LDFHALFAIFPAESRIKTFFIDKLSLEVDEFSILCSVSAGKSYEKLSAEFYPLPLFKTIGNPDSNAIESAVSPLGIVIIYIIYK